MKTLEKTTHVYTKTELQEKINTTIDKIKKWVNIMDYRIVGNIDDYKKLEIPVNNLSKNQLKKINAFSNSLNKRMTLRKVNSFLHIIYKTLEPIKKVQIKKSEKEEAIQKARKNWLKLRNEAEQALLEYKEEKGDYYKNQTQRRNMFTL